MRSHLLIQEMRPQQFSSRKSRSKRLGLRSSAPHICWKKTKENKSWLRTWPPNLLWDIFIWLRKLWRLNVQITRTRPLVSEWQVWIFQNWMMKYKVCLLLKWLVESPPRQQQSIDYQMTCLIWRMALLNLWQALIINLAHFRLQPTLV